MGDTVMESPRKIVRSDGKNPWPLLSKLSDKERKSKSARAVLPEEIGGVGNNGHGSALTSRLSSDNNYEREYEFEQVFPVYALGYGRQPHKGLRQGLDCDGVDFIWEAIREEAQLEAEKEPILSSFLYSSILYHDCLERSLGFVLANLLQNLNLSACQLLDVFVSIIMEDKDIRRAIRSDVQAFKDRDPACLSYCWVLLYRKGYHSLQSYRVAHALWNKDHKVLALALQSRISEVLGVDIHPAARIGEQILLDHATGVVIGETAVIGNRVSLMQGITLGGTGKGVGDRHPKIGDGALIGVGANILGNISIGEGAMITAGSLVLKDVPPHSIIAGIPAKVIGHVNEQDPSRTMKHDAPKELFEQAPSSSEDRRLTVID